MGEGSANLTDPHHTPIITQPSSSQPQKKHKSRRPKEKDTQVPQSSVPSDLTNVADEDTKRAKEKRNIPPIRAQQRSIMCTYLKNMAGWKPRDLKRKTELVEGTEMEEISKKAEQTVDDDQESTKMKELMKIVPDEEEVAVDAIPLATKPPSIMLRSFDKEDLETLWKLVKAKHGRYSVEEFTRKKVLVWKLFDSCRVHFGKIVGIKRQLDDLRVTAIKQSQIRTSVRATTPIRGVARKGSVTGSFDGKLGFEDARRCLDPLDTLARRALFRDARYDQIPEHDFAIASRSEEIDLTFFPLAPGPYVRPYPFEGDSSLLYTKQQWDGPHLPKNNILCKEIFRDPDVCRRALDQTITPIELRRTESLLPLELSNHFNVFSALLVSHDTELNTRYTNLVAYKVCTQEKLKRKSGLVYCSGGLLGKYTILVGKENGVNIIKSIDEGPFQMGTFRETHAEGNEGSELTKEDRESQLYDDFEHFRQNKGETIHDYYVRFAKLINDMRNIKMTMSRMQLNSKFVNNMLPEWGRFVTVVKLNRGLKDSNYDQLYAYLKQHKAHANENKMMLDRFTQHTVDHLALMSNVSHQYYYSQSSTTPPSTHV
ncbi:hypothetical protein Tco_0737873 [Tanacetum coccineum]